MDSTSNLVFSGDYNWDINTGGKPMKRERYLELAKIAKEICELLEKKGVTAQEGCKVRKLAEELWTLEK